MNITTNVNDSPSSKRYEKRKRHRLPVSCNRCRQRKIGCDKKHPCGVCVQNGKACEYGSDGSSLHAAAPSSGQFILDINAWSSQTRHNPSGLKTPESSHAPIGYAQLTTTDEGRSLSTNPTQALSRLDCNIQKSRLFGESHWMNNTIEFPGLVTWRSLFCDENDELHPLLKECKQLARKLKSIALARTEGHPDLRALVPRKEVCDKLAQSYLDTFEPIFRIFHLPSFRMYYAQYWADPQHASDASVVQLLLVAAIGACFYNDESNPEPPLHIQSSEWVYAVQAWLNVSLAKQTMNLSGVQIHCLLVLALQTTAVGGDLSWIAAGSLVRTAMTIGLHRDPIHLPKMSVLQAEMRRRLWATTLEIATQTSLDAGMPPLISWKDFDCNWPLNIDDGEIDETTTIRPTSCPVDVFTHNSIQCALTRSLLTRLKITKLLNNLHSQFSHEDAVQIGTELANVSRANSKLFNTWIRATSLNASKPTSFQTKMLDILTRRFLLSIHLPFAKKAMTNVAYYYSRKVCADSALQLLSYTPQSPSLTPMPAGDDHYTRLRIHGRGMFRAIQIQSSAQVAMELVATLREDPGVSRSSLSRNELYQSLLESTAIAQRRIEAGETNVRMYVCLSCVLGQIHALDGAGMSAEQALEASRRTSLEWSIEVLKGRVRRADGEELRSKDHARDSVTTSTDTGDVRVESAFGDPIPWDPSLVTDDWSAWLPPEWENEGRFFDDEL